MRWRRHFLLSTNLCKVIKCSISPSMIDFLLALWRYDQRQRVKRVFDDVAEPSLIYPVLPTELVVELLTLANGDIANIPSASVLYRADPFGTEHDRKWWCEPSSLLAKEWSLVDLVPPSTHGSVSSSGTIPDTKHYNSTHLGLYYMASLPGIDGEKLVVSGSIDPCTLICYHFAGPGVEDTLEVCHLGNTGEPQFKTTITRAKLLAILATPDIHSKFATRQMEVADSRRK